MLTANFREVTESCLGYLKIMLAKPAVTTTESQAARSDMLQMLQRGTKYIEKDPDQIVPGPTDTTQHFRMCEDEETPLPLPIECR